MKKLFIGNLSWTATEEALKPLFEAYGKVISVRIVTDPYTGRSKGFGFVEMEDEASAQEAIKGLNDSNFLDRPLRVSQARQEERAPRSGGNRSGGGGGYGGQQRSGGYERRYNGGDRGDRGNRFHNG